MEFTEKAVIDGFINVIWYNCYDDEIREWIKGLEKTINDNEYSFRCPMFRPWPDDRDELCQMAQLQTLWMIIVEWFGDYDTSPRSGWIDKPKECKEFLEKIIKEIDDMQ